MLVNVIVGGAEGDTTGGRKGVILMSTEVVGIQYIWSEHWMILWGLKRGEMAWIHRKRKMISNGL
jgi:hypothetical protein